MVGRHDLHRPFAQALEELPAHRSLGIDGVGAEVLLRVTWKQRLKQGDDGLVGGVHQIDHVDGVVNRVADVLLQRVELRAPDGIGRGAQLVDDHVGEKDRSEHAEDRAEGSVEHHRRDLDLRVRKLGRDLDNHQDREDDPEKAVDPPVGYLKARRLLQDAAGLDTHVGRRPHGDEQSHETDEPPDQAGEEATRGIREDEHDRKNVDPRHLALPPEIPIERHANACEIRARPHSRNLARCLFSSPSLISDKTLSTSASVRVRPGLRKVKVNAMLLCPSETWAPRYSSNARATSRRSPADSLIDARMAPAATVSSTTTARSRSTAGKRGSGWARGMRAAASSGSTSTSNATYLPSSLAAAVTDGCSSPT